MTDTPRRNGARDDGTYTREQRIELFRWVYCDGMQVMAACRRMPCSKTAFYEWRRATDEVDEAKALGPTGDAPPAGPGPGAGEDPFADLPPIGEEKPDDPSPEFMATLALRYGLNQDTARLDRLAAWPSGTVQGWFDRAQRGDRACAIRVAQLERAAEIVIARAELALLESGNPVALTKFLISRGAMSEAPAAAKNGAEGHPTPAIAAQLERLFLGRKGAGG